MSIPTQGSDPSLVGPDPDFLGGQYSDNFAGAVLEEYYRCDGSLASPPVTLSSTVTIKYCDIPSYLHAGDFYRSLEEDFPECTIEIPADCMHYNGSSAFDWDEVYQLLRVMRFWILDEVPLGVIRFYWEHHNTFTRGWMFEVDASFQPTWRPIVSDVRLFHEVAWVEDLLLKSNEVLRQRASQLDIRPLPCKLLEPVVGCLSDERPVLRSSAWHDNACALAACHGRLSRLQYAHTSGHPLRSNVYIYCAQGGYLECMQYAHRQGLEWTSATSAYAAYHGRLECLQYAHENGCPWDIKTTNAAAYAGHLHCLQYALEQGCAWSEETCYLACSQCRVNCVELLYRLSSPNSDTRLRWAMFAAMCSTDECLRYLHGVGCAWNEHVAACAALSGSADCLEYLLGNECAYNEFLVPNAVRGGSLKCLGYLIEIEGLFMSDVVFWTALLMRKHSALTYLLSQYCPTPKFPSRREASIMEYYDSVYASSVHAVSGVDIKDCVALAERHGWSRDYRFDRFLRARGENLTEIKVRAVKKVQRKSASDPESWKYGKDSESSSDFSNYSDAFLLDEPESSCVIF